MTNEEALNCSEIPNNSDTISRQQAIEAVEKSMYENPHENAILRGMHDHEHRHFLTILMGLPSAQPDIIYCKDCKFYTAYDYTGKLMCKRIGKGMILPKPEDYCSYAERITDG